jgi:hypothetical protein
VKVRIIVAIGAMTLLAGAASASASTERSGELLMIKDCTHDTFLSGGSCSITSSNVPEIGVGSMVFYDQAAGTPTGLLDSNVVLDAGHGNRAVGRCTLDLSTKGGLCTFSDGTGDLAGFSARLDVACASLAVCRLDGTYRFHPVQ